MAGGKGTLIVDVHGGSESFRCFLNSNDRLRHHDPRSLVRRGALTFGRVLGEQHRTGIDNRWSFRLWCRELKLESVSVGKIPTRI